MNTSKIFPLVFLAITSLSLCSQSDPGGIKWRSIDWAARESTTGLPQAQTESGEDWWYDHKNVLDGQGNHIGYIAAGFAQGLNRVDDYEAEEDGCYSCEPNFSNYDCSRLESPQAMSVCARQMLFEYDKDGNMKWCRTYNSGDFNSVIQTSDGGFLAGGHTFSTRNVNNPNSWVSGIRGHSPGSSGSPIKELYYNPTGSNTDFFGDFPGEPCSEYAIGAVPLNAYNRVALIKTNSEGKIEWNYQYGVEDYDSGNNGKKAFRQKIRWVDMVEANGFYWIVAGITTFNESSGQSVIDKDGTFIAQLNSDGELINKKMVDLQTLSGGSPKAYAVIHEANTNSLYLAGRGLK